MSCPRGRGTAGRSRAASSVCSFETFYIPFPFFSYNFCKKRTHLWGSRNLYRLLFSSLWVSLRPLTAASCKCSHLSFSCGSTSGWMESRSEVRLTQSIVLCVDHENSGPEQFLCVRRDPITRSVSRSSFLDHAQLPLCFLL